MPALLTQQNSPVEVREATAALNHADELLYFFEEVIRASPNSGAQARRIIRDRLLLLVTKGLLQEKKITGSNP
jgi:hypothetical protein